MPRFMTVETYEGKITAYNSDCDSKSILDNADVAEWVWQFARTKKIAIAQHTAKHDEWAAGIDAGHKQKETY